MTLPVRNSRRVVTNTGSVTAIDVDFPADQAQYVKVYAGLPGRYEMVLGVDYTLTGVAAGSEDFTVNILDPGGWDDYQLLVVSVEYAVEQPSDVDVGGPFGLRFENALDRLALIMQSLEDRVNRAVKMPVTGPVGPGNELVPNPDELIGWNADGTALETKPQISQSVQLAIDKAAEAAQSVLDAAEIVDTFELNVAGYTITFNNNAAAATTAFDDNAAARTAAFDSNAASKTAAFDANAAGKIVVMDGLLSDTEDAALAAAQSVIEAEGILASGRVPLGTIIHSAIPQTDNGYLLCNGSPVTALYPDLRAALIAAGSPFGTSGADPKLPDEVTVSRFRRAANGSIPLGTVQDDQMQQITGEFGDIRDTGLVAAGAFSKGTSRALSATGTVASTSMLFDSANSPGARTGTETRPKSIAYLPYIKAFGAITVEGMADLSQLLNAIATEAEAALGANNTKLMTPLRTWQSGSARDARFLHVRDQKASGTAGGGTTAGATAVRTLNTTVINGISGASLSSNQVTLPAGTYDVDIAVPAYNIGGGHKAWLRTSGGTVLLQGSSEGLPSAGNASNRSSIKGRITLASTTAVEVAHYATGTQGTNGQGVPASSGQPEIYTEAMFWKVD